MRVPLAWLNLTHRPLRLMVFLAGIGFAVLLMFVQLGFWCALLDSVAGVINHLNADLVIINRAKYVLDMPEPFPRQWLYQAQAVAGVNSVAPLYVRTGFWKVPDLPVRSDPLRKPMPSQQFIRVLAFDPASKAMDFPQVAQDANELRLPGTAFWDRKSKKGMYGMRPGPFTTELCEQHLELIGTFDLGTDFSSNGNLVMSDQNYAAYFRGLTTSYDPLQDVEVGLVRLKKGADAQVVQKGLVAALPADVLVLTRGQYARNEQRYWENATPVGFIFRLGLLVGFVVGVVICSQILSSDVSDHLPEYATLKAIGYTNRYLTGVVLSEALLLSLVGFIPGYFLSKLFYLLLGQATGLPLDLTWDRGLGVLVLTMAMCVISGFVAVGKVWVADPAEVF